MATTAPSRRATRTTAIVGYAIRTPDGFETCDCSTVDGDKPQIVVWLKSDDAEAAAKRSGYTSYGIVPLAVHGPPIGQ